MVTIDEMSAMLDEIAAEMPEEIYQKLNGGILLLPQAKLHEQSVDGDLFVLGEYHVDGRLGRYIAIYYGSFMQVCGGLAHEPMREKLRATVKHEFIHHLESMAGEKDLEHEDERHLAEYMERKRHAQAE